MTAFPRDLLGLPVGSRIYRTWGVWRARSCRGCSGISAAEVQTWKLYPTP